MTDIAKLSLPIPEAKAFLREAARYFGKRETNGEDMAFWANAYNAENCLKIIGLIDYLYLAIEREVPAPDAGLGTSTDTLDRPESREFALDAAEHIIGMVRDAEDEDNCLSEGADVVLEAAEKMRLAFTRNAGLKQRFLDAKDRHGDFVLGQNASIIAEEMAAAPATRNPRDGTIQNYEGNDPEISVAVTTLECFIGDMENAELADDSTVDASDAAWALNLLTGRLNFPSCDPRNEALEEAAKLIEKMRRNNLGLVHPAAQADADAIRALKSPSRNPRNEALEEAAKLAENIFGGKAHTYASENADHYRTQDFTIEHIAKAIRALKSPSRNPGRTIGEEG